MNTKPLIVLALATLAFGVPAITCAADAKETLATFHAALTAGDKATALGLLSPDVIIYEGGYVERSRAEYESQHLDGDIAFAKSSTRKVLKQTEHIDGNTAIISEETETAGTARGNPVHVRGTGTAVLQKDGERWTIVHLHWSSRKVK